MIMFVMAHDVFISASSKGKAAADAVCNVLERNRIRVWMAPRDIVPGVGWAASIIGAINGAKIMVLVFSSHANSSPQIEREVERAINKEIPVIPFRVENVEPSDALEYFISAPHWLDAFAPPLEPHLERLAEAVRRLLDSEIARVTQQEERRKATEAEVFRLAEEERQKREAAEAARRAEEERRRAEAEAARLAEAERQRKEAEEAARQVAEVQRRPPEEEWRAAVEADASRAADKERQRQKVTEASRQAEEERVSAASEADRQHQIALPDVAPDLEEAARPAQTFDSGILSGNPESGANRVEIPKNAGMRSKPASNWGIFAATVGFPFALTVFYLLIMDIGHTPPSSSELSTTENGNASTPATPATLAPVLGDAHAVNNLGDNYYYGRGVAQDEAEAVRLYRQAANLGYASAILNLGFMFENGRGVAMDEAEAVRLYRQTADLGDTTAMHHLGFMYENGIGVTKDIAKARSYYQMDADRGDSDAKEVLKRLSARPKKR